MRIVFDQQPEVGFGISIGRHAYMIVQHDQRTNRHGDEVQVSIWRGRCAECGAAFDQYTRMDFAPESCRCAEHKRPGKRATMTNTVSEGAR
uniref:hypothetical protein n=1 Tax=Edaphosphingomonas laterariae TaxID=861865 RepID=UPI0011819ECB|nr:hypothetical protein [Sphingomonas laterariae]